MIQIIIVEAISQRKIAQGKLSSLVLFTVQIVG